LPILKRTKYILAAAEGQASGEAEITQTKTETLTC